MNSNNTVQQAILDFYSENDFGDDGGIHEKYAWIKFGFFSIPIPNAESRRNNVYLHDVHHIVTNFDTTWKGESAVSAWEIASGGWGKLYVPWLLTLWAMGLGVLFYPKTTFAAFTSGLTMNNVLRSGLTKNEINNLTVTDLQRALSNKSARYKSSFLWAFTSLVVFLFPFLMLLFIVWIWFY
jgi:hypothetical protein